MEDKQPRRIKHVATKRGRTEDGSQTIPSKKKLKLSEVSDSATLPEEVVPKDSLKTRMSPSGIMKFINSSPSEQQLLDIQSIGFGGVMKLNTDTVPGVLSKWLLTDFNTCNCSLMNGALRVDDIDVHLATGLPMGSIDIKEATSGSRDEYFLGEKQKWMEQFGANKVTKEALLDKMISQKDGGDEFKRNFIVYITSAFLMGSKGVFVSARILNCLGDLSKVSSLNWYTFTRRYMVTSIEKWRAVLNPKKVYKGPIMPLVFIYLDRVEFKWQTVKRVFPTLSSWSKKDISNRVGHEKKYGFGKGAVQDRIVLGVEEDGRGKEKVFLVFDKKTNDEEVKAGPSNTECMVTKLGKDAVHFAHAYEHFSAALNEAQLSAPKSDFVHKMSVLAQGVCDGFNASEKPIEHKAGPSDENQTVVDDDGVRLQDKNKEMEHDNNQRCDVDSDLATDAELCALMEELEKSFTLPPYNNRFVNKKKSKKEKDPSMPNFDLLGSEFDSTQDSEFENRFADSTQVINEPESHQPYTTVNVPKSSNTTTRRVSPRLNPSKLIIGVDSCSDRMVEGNVEEVVAKGKQKLEGEFSLSESPVSPTLESKLPLCKSPISAVPIHKDDTTVVQPKRAIVVPEYFRSPFMQRNINVFRDLTKFEKLIIDLALLEEDSTSDSEILFKSARHSINRSELKTLFLGDRVSESVVKVWCEILNMGEDDKSKSSPLRLYLSMGEGDKSKSANDLPKINFNDVKLVFLPFTSTGKPFLFCVHPTNRKIEVIHAMKPKSVPYQFRITACKDTFDGRLKNKMNGVDMINWLDVQEYVPSRNIGDRLDSGIHVMYFMDSYKGTRRGYSCDLNSDVRLKRFIGRACSRILCSDLNTLQQKIKKDALALPTRKCTPGPSNLNLLIARDSSGNALTIKYIKDYLRRSHDQQEVLVDTEWIEVTLGAVRSLNPRGKLMDMVIDAIGIRNCLADPDFLYLPSIVKDLDPQRPETLYTQYVKMTYIPKDGEQVRKVFMPIVIDNHWFAVVVDLLKMKTFILNSLIDPNTKIEIRDIVADMVFNVEALIKRDHGYSKLFNMASFEIVFVNVPQQTNLHDCGLFVLKWIEAVNDEGLWTQKDYYKGLTDYRDCKMLELLTWDMNRKKV